MFQVLIPVECDKEGRGKGSLNALYGAVLCSGRGKSKEPCSALAANEWWNYIRQELVKTRITRLNALESESRLPWIPSLHQKEMTHG